MAEQGSIPRSDLTDHELLLQSCAAGLLQRMHPVGTVLESFMEEIIFEMGPEGWVGFRWVEMQDEESF